MAKPLFGLAVVLVVSACSGRSALAPWHDVDCVRALQGSDHAPAVEWLKDPFGGPKTLGRLSAEEALALVDALDTRGAKRIEAVRVEKRQGPEPSQSSPGLVVEVPDEPARRKAIFQLYAKVVRESGYEPRKDEGQQFLYVVAGER